MGPSAVETGLSWTARRVCRGLHAAAVAAGVILISSGAAAASKIPSIPLMYTSIYSRSERVPMQRSAPKEISTTMDNSVNFSSKLPGVGSLSEQVNMNFMQSTKRMPGNKGTMTNLGYNLSMSGRNLTYLSTYSLVENETEASGAVTNSRSESTGMGMNVSWPKMPAFNLMFSNYKMERQSAETGQLNMSYRLGQTSVNFNQVTSKSVSNASPEGKSDSASLGISRQQMNTKKMNIMTTLNTTRQKSYVGGIAGSRSSNGSFALSITDSHIKLLPLSVNFTANRSRQQTPNGADILTQISSGRNINTYTSVVVPGGIRTSVSYNVSWGKSSSSTAGSSSKARVLSIGSVKNVGKDTSINYNYTAQTNDSTASKNTAVSISTTFWKSTTMGASWGQSQAAGAKSSYINMNTMSRLPGNIMLTQQYLTSRAAGARQMTESTNISVPLGSGSMLGVSTSIRKASPHKDVMLGITHSMPLNRATSVSTTFTRQKTDGVTQGRTWGMNLSSMLPMRTTLNVGLTVQRDKDFKNLSTTVSMTGSL